MQVDEATKGCLASEMNLSKELEIACKQYKEREDLLIRIIADNCDLDVEQLLNGENGQS